jgi:F0F1-type ATP synthase beta subunit
MLGMERLSKDEYQFLEASCNNFSQQPHVIEQTQDSRSLVDGWILSKVNMIIDGELDHLPKSAFLLVQMKTLGEKKYCREATKKMISFKV